MVSIEYLIPFATKDGICIDTHSFNSLICAHSDLTLSENKIHYKSEQFHYAVALKEQSEHDYTIFHVKFQVNESSETFREMLRAFRSILGKVVKDDVQVIWDDTGFKWNLELYERIFHVENSFRKLISQFMLVNLGVGWHKAAVPNPVKESIKSKSYKEDHGILYEVDFIQLANFLFAKYSNKDAKELPDLITKVLESDIDGKTRDQLLEYVPLSNWDRYFSKIVECGSEQLQKKWKELYIIRNKVAHNKTLTHSDYSTGIELCSFIEPLVKEANEKVGEVEIPEEKLSNLVDEVFFNPSLYSLPPMVEDIEDPFRLGSLLINGRRYPNLSNFYNDEMYHFLNAIPPLVEIEEQKETVEPPEDKSEKGGNLD